MALDVKELRALATAAIASNVPRSKRNEQHRAELQAELAAHLGFDEACDPQTILAVLDRLERAEAVCAAAGVFMDTRCLRLEGGAFQKAINTADDAESKLYASVDRWREEVQP